VPGRLGWLTLTVTVAVASGAAGCDRLFRLRELDPGADGGKRTDARPRDGGGPDATADARVAAGHDEDADTIDDALDNCPAVNNVTQDDGDGDQVGNACDPHPTLPIDRIRYFDPLTTFSAWSVVAGAWAPTGDEVVQSDTGETLAVLDGLGVLTDPSVMVTLTAQTGTDGGAYLITGGTPTETGPEGMICYLNTNTTPTEYIVVWDDRPVPGGGFEYYQQLAGTDYPLTIMLQASVERGGVVGGPSACIGTRAGVAAQNANTAETNPIATAKIGLYTWYATTRFASVTVFDDRP